MNCINVGRERNHSYSGKSCPDHFHGFLLIFFDFEPQEAREAREAREKLGPGTNQKNPLHHQHHFDVLN
jgi:hypothetical protein